MNTALFVSLLVVVGLLLLLKKRPSKESFYTPDDGRKPVSATWDISTLDKTVGLAVDTAIPRIGDTTPEQVVGDEVRRAMRFAVGVINSRRSLDLEVIDVDNQSKASNAVKAKLLAGDVHAYSEHFNAGITLRLEVMDVDGHLYLRQAQPTTTVDPNDSGVQPANPDVFTVAHADFQPLV